MKKLFFAICFIVSITFSLSAFSAVSTINEAELEQAASKKIDPFQPVEGLPDPDNLTEVINFFKKRFQNANVSTAEQMGDLSKPNSMNIQHSKEYIEDLQKEKKSTFEKIYEQAMNRISGEDTSAQNQSNTIFYTSNQKQPAIQDIIPSDTPVVNVLLPNGKQILAPALEHIPYLLTSINILPTGLIQIDEEITVIANNKKLKNGVIKILPKFSKSRSGVRKKLDINLLNVTVNGKNIPYVLEEIGDKIYIKPQQKYNLTPGVYNYKFSYFLDRKLWYYDDFTEFYWDVSGSYLNLVIGSANAIVSIADGKSFLSQNIMIGYPKTLSVRRAVVAKLDTNALGFASITPILPGEGMHILVSLDKNVFLSPDINRSFVWFITDYGDILFSVFGLLAVVISYMLSWNYIKKNKSKLSASFKNTAATARYFIYNIFDKKSFIAQLIELKKKQYIDIQKQDDTLLLIKKTDNLSKLSKRERKSLNNLFTGKDSVISATNANSLKFKRAYDELEKQHHLSIKKLNFKLNFGYLAFSIGMLILIEIAISMLGINTWQTAAILLSSSITIAFYTYMLKRKFNSKILKYIIKTFGVIFIIFAVLFMSIYIHLISAIILAMIIYAIFEYSSLFSKRGGLLKNKIKEMNNLKEYLEKNVTIISTSQDFVTQQAYIYALDLEHLYAKNDFNKKAYVLDDVKKIETLL